MKEALLLRGGRIIDPSQGIDGVEDLFIAEGRIAARGQNLEPDQPCLVLHAQKMIVCPGLIDIHCHLRQPGYEEKETIATGTRAAARGGFTTLCCMPNTNPPIDTRQTVEFILKTAQDEGAVRVLPIGAITKGQKGEELVEMGDMAQAGAVAFSDDAAPLMNSRIMRHALEYSLAFGVPVIVHCEDTSLTEGGAMHEGWVSARLGLRGMPAAAEETMVARNIALAQLAGARLHIAHVSVAGSVDLLRQAKERGIAVTGEATPHHLTLTEERVLAPPSYDTNAKINPPLRSKRDLQALLEGLKDGAIDALATDHTPHTLVDKMCEFDLAAFGISGLETALGSFLSLVHRGVISLATLISKLTLEPVKVIGGPLSLLGTLKVGAPADVTLFDPEREWVVDPEGFASKGRNTPLAGSVLKGKAMATVFGGEIVYKDEAIKLEAVSAAEAKRA